MRDYSIEELAREAVELLPDRDTLQVTSTAYNIATVTQTATSSANDNIVIGGSVSSTAYNTADVAQNAASSANYNTVLTLGG